HRDRRAGDAGGEPGDGGAGWPQGQVRRGRVFQGRGDARLRQPLSIGSVKRLAAFLAPAFIACIAGAACGRPEPSTPPGAARTAEFVLRAGPRWPPGDSLDVIVALAGLGPSPRAVRAPRVAIARVH